MDVKLISLKSTPCLTAVCLSSSDNPSLLYYLNNEDHSTTFSQHEETNSTSYKSNGTRLVHNIYDSEDVYYKSAIYSRPISKRDSTTYDFVNSFSYNMPSSLTNIEKIGNTLYSYANLYTNGHVRISSDSYSFLSIDNGSSSLYDVSVATVTYDKQKIKDVLSTNPEELTSTNVTLCSYIGVNYNMLYEFPGNIWNDYTSGNIAANTLRCKNHLDSSYNMNHDDTYVFKNCRKYIGILPCNNQLYLKYIDTEQYQKNGQSSNVRSSNTTKTYEFIEGVDSITRYSNRDGNKSSLYSLKITTKLVDANRINNNAVLDTIKTSIKSISYQLAKKLQPVTSELINVYLESK